MKLTPAPVARCRHQSGSAVRAIFGLWRSSSWQQRRAGDRIPCPVIHAVLVSYKGHIQDGSTMPLRLIRDA
jgi:hypothetical protein